MPSASYTKRSSQTRKVEAVKALPELRSGTNTGCCAQSKRIAKACVNKLSHELGRDCSPSTSIVQARKLQFSCTCCGSSLSPLPASAALPLQPLRGIQHHHASSYF